MPRLNPFAFPTDTDFRLLLLIAAILGSTLFVYNWVYLGLPQSRGELQAYQHCRLVASAAGTDVVIVEQIFDSCRAPVEQRKAAWMLGGVGLVLLGAFALYALSAQVILRRRRLIPLAPEDAPDVIQALGDLCQRAALRPPPQFVWNPLNGAAVGLAFGHRGGYYVALTGGLVTRFYGDRPAFDAVVLHELAHLRNGDVDKTYLAIGLWQAFVVFGLAPLALTLILAPDVRSGLSEAWILGWRAIALAALVYLVRNAVLRSRETYADLRSAEWEGSVEPLERVLGSVKEPRRSGFNRWRDAFDLHPSRESRQDALVDTRPLFRIGAWDAFAAGITAGLAYPVVVSLIELMFTGAQAYVFSWTTGEVAAAFTAALLSLLIAGVVGVGLWRATFAAMMAGRRIAWPVAVSAALSVGLGLGGWVGFDGGFQLLPSDPVSIVIYFIVSVGGLTLLAGGVFLILRWFAGTSSRSLRVALAGNSAPGWLLSYVMLAVVLAVWLTVTLQARGELAVAAGSGLPPWTYPIFASAPLAQAVFNPIGLIGVACLVVFPLVAAIGGGDVGKPPAWAFLDPPPAGLYPAEPGPDVQRILLTALAGAAVYLVVEGGTRLMVGSTARWDVGQIMLFFGAEVGIAVLVQIGVAVAIASRATALQVAQGVAAAAVCGVLMAMEAFWVNVALGGQADPNGAWVQLLATIFAGLLFTLPSAWVAGAMRTDMRRMDHAQRP